MRLVTYEEFDGSVKPHIHATTLDGNTVQVSFFDALVRSYAVMAMTADEVRRFAEQLIVAVNKIDPR